MDDHDGPRASGCHREGRVRLIRHMPQFALVSTGFCLVVALMIWGSVTRSAITKRVLFWTLFVSIASASYLFTRN
jgi:hypothetical protein